jgi:hypothetical protein
MSLRTYIEQAKTRPEAERKRLAFWWALGGTFVIFAFWLGSFSGFGLAGGASGASATVAKAVNSAGTPSQSLVAGVGAFAGDIWSMIAGPKKVAYSEIIVTPGVK